MQLFHPELIEKAWGGSSLEERITGNKSERLIGEAWCVSGLPGTAYHPDYNLLIKILECTSPLSLQVHPSDAIAVANGDRFGKAEAWLVLECDKDTRVVHGLKDGVTRQVFESALRKDPSNILDLCEIKSVSAGDIIPIEPGTVHTVLGNMIWAEVQQASDVTYRLYDFGRTNRELHLEKGLDCIRYEKSCNFVVGSWFSEWFTMEEIGVDDQIVADYPLETWLSLGETVLEGKPCKLGTTALIPGGVTVEASGHFLRVY